MDMTKEKPIMIIDAYNMIHRCRFEWGGGLAISEFGIVYNFFRALRHLTEEKSPSEIYFTLDGRPQHRLELDGEYKANRKTDSSTMTDEEIDYWVSFHQQKRIIIDMVKDYMPIKTAYHPLYEGDDVVLHIVEKILSDDPMKEIMIVSSDTDFIQILNSYPDSVTLWNPISKTFRSNTDYDYVSWKAMVGDRSDNIPGVKGIGKVTAEKILKKHGALQDRLLDPTFKESYEKSYQLIKLNSLSDVSNEIEFSESQFFPDDIERLFDEMGFQSLLKDSYLNKFNKIFRTLV